MYPDWLDEWKRVFYDMDELTLLASVIYGEARGEPYLGKVAVGCVVRNRVLQPSWWGDSYHRVILAREQFSCLNEDQKNKAIPRILKHKDAKSWKDCQEVAYDIISGATKDITAGADHYFADHVPKPAWSERMLKTMVIGHHEFYNSLGAS